MAEIDSLASKPLLCNVGPQCVTGNAACPPAASRLSGRAAMTGTARAVLLLRVLAVLAGDHLLLRTRDALLVLDRVMTDR